MESLELLVQIDPWMSSTSRYTDYVIAPTMELEVPGATLLTDMLLAGDYFYGPHSAHAQYTDAIVDPPGGSDVIQEWEFFYGLAQRLGLELKLGGFVYVSKEPVALDMRSKPSIEDIIEILTA